MHCLNVLQEMSTIFITNKKRNPTLGGKSEESVENNEQLNIKKKTVTVLQSGTGLHKNI